MRLNHALLEQRVLKEQLLDHLIAEVEVVDAVAELLFRNDVTAAVCAWAGDCEGAFLSHFYYLFHSKNLVLSQQVELQGLGLIGWDQLF